MEKLKTVIRFKVATYGIYSHQFDEIYFDLLKSNLPLELVYSYRSNEKNHFQLKEEDRFDLFIVNPNHFIDEADIIVKKIKSLRPKAEVVILSRNEDYLSAIKCFRHGVRDVLIYPYRIGDFIMAINQSVLYLSLYHQSEKLGPLVQMINQFSDSRNYTDISSTLFVLDEFLSEYWGVKGTFVVSVKNAELAIIWNKRGVVAFKLENAIREYVLGLIEKPRSDNEIVNFFNHEYFVGKIQLNNGENIYIFIPLAGENKLSILDLFKDFGFTILKNSFIQIHHGQNQERYLYLSQTDDVSGLLNQRKLQEDLDHFILKHTNQTVGFCVLFIDLDYFKTVNDEFGHIIGTKLLKRVGQLIKKSVRENDLVYRYGGDEFVVILPNTLIKEAEVIGERVLKKIKGESLFDLHINYELSASIGVAHFPIHAKTADELIAIADKMMYSAKKSGRGRVFSL